MPYTGEIHRCVDEIELREKLRLEYDITDEEYRSEHSVTGEISGLVSPDREVVRSRAYPPSNLIATGLQSVIEAVGDGSVGKGYPGTDVIVAVTRVPPVTQRDEQFQEGFAQQEFTVDGIQENGTITLDCDWDLERARDSLSNDELKTVAHEYDVDGLPADQLPIVIRANLDRDAREYLENKPSTVYAQREQSLLDPKEVEGMAALSIVIEYREDSPETIVAGGNGRLSIENFRLEMESTFPNIKFGPRKNATYNPEQKRIEWRKRTPTKEGTGDSDYGPKIQYDVFGQMEELLDLGAITVSFRGRIRGDTLSGTKIVGLYDRTGRNLADGDRGQVQLKNDVAVIGEIEIDPTALPGRARKVMDASVSLKDTPFDAFDRLQTVCNREGMTIRSSKEPSNPEPVVNREGVLEIRQGEKNEGDDEPGELKVKREYGDEGVVYAHMLVYGRFTAMSQDREVSQSAGWSDRTEDRLVRADEGPLEERGKATVDIRARSVESELNSRFVQTIQEGLGGGYK